MAPAMVPVATTSSPFEARLLAARLGADGFLWELRGSVDGPYPVGPVQVLVRADQADDVRALLLVDEVEEVFEAAAHDGAGTRVRRRDAWAAAIVAAGVVVLTVLRALSAA